MGKWSFLASCSIATVCLSSTAAHAQQVPADQQRVRQDAITNPATPEEETPVPTNSDAAEDQKVRDAVDAKEREKNPAEVDEQAAERAKAEQIVKLRRSLPPEKPVDEGTITVTGSRLRNGDQTSRLTVIDAQEIRARGVTSVEELIRTLPQNVATVGAITNNRTRGPLRDSRGTPIVSAVGGLGVAAANLGGVGAGNTLILINGRRIAGAAGIEGGYANLNGIPLSAIDRVEVSTEGASAIYGADALGGVINFILKKNYVGTTASFQHEFSSGGADTTRANVYSGYAWGSGNISGTLDFVRRKPIVNRKTGYVTNNYADRFDGNPYYDKRSFTSGLQPGVIDRPAVFDPETGSLLQPETGLTVLNGLAGRPTRDDFVQIGLDSARDYVPTYAGPSSRTVSATLSGEQRITGKLRVFANGLYTRAKNSQESLALRGVSILLGPGQYYNPFDAYEVASFSAGTRVAYYPGSEIADGTLKAGSVRNTTDSWNASVGAGYDFDPRTKLEVIYTVSGSSTSGNSRDAGNLVTDFVEDPTAPGGFRCVNSDLANGIVANDQLAAFQAAFDRQCLALTSTDPAKAFNPFKSATNGGGASINEFVYVPLRDDLGATLHNVEARLTGSVLKLPAGQINYAVGGEYARSSTSSTQIASLVGGSGVASRYAFFGEATVPILGKDFALPLVRRLLFNVAVRRDVTSSTGAVGTVDNIPIDRGGQIIYGKSRFGRTTPAYGLLWSPFSSLDLRAKFTSGFKAPPPTQLFTLQGSNVYETFIGGDPLYTCTTDCAYVIGGIPFYAVPARISPNPDLKPETSRQQVFSGSWQPTGFLTGLNLALTYNHNRIRNQFATITELQRYLPLTEILRIPQFYPRDATGKITSQQNIRFNIIGSDYKSLTYEASYLFNTGIGSFQPKVTVVQNLVAHTVGTQNSFVLDQRGRILGVDKFRAVGSLQWNEGPFSANLFVYHTPSYLNDYGSFYFAGQEQAPELITKVRSFTTADLSISWVASKQLSLQFAGRNILKANPPFTVVDTLPYDTARYNVAGRTLSFSAQCSF